MYIYKIMPAGKGEERDGPALWVPLETNSIIPDHSPVHPLFGASHGTCHAAAFSSHIKPLFLLARVNSTCLCALPVGLQKQVVSGLPSWHRVASRFDYVYLANCLPQRITLLQISFAIFAFASILISM